jgi:pimeloyl-ACP methyl ester carboxylesterase
VPEGKDMDHSEKTMGTVNRIFILHGWSYETDKWTPFVQAMKKRGVACELLQIPGLTTAIDKPWNAADYVAWLDGILPKKPEKAVLVGHSNGGRIALWYAATHPDRIVRLILIDSAGVYDSGAALTLKRAVFRLLAKSGKRITRSKTLRRLLYRLARVRDYDEAAPVMKQTMVNLLKADASIPFKKITVPVTIIWGRMDSVTPVKDAETLKNRLPQAVLSVIDSARHSPQFSHPDQVADLIWQNESV